MEIRNLNCVVYKLNYPELNKPVSKSARSVKYKPEIY